MLIGLGDMISFFALQTVCVLKLDRKLTKMTLHEFLVLKNKHYDGQFTIISACAHFNLYHEMVIFI